MKPNNLWCMYFLVALTYEMTNFLSCFFACHFRLFICAFCYAWAHWHNMSWILSLLTRTTTMFANVLSSRHHREKDCLHPLVHTRFILTLNLWRTLAAKSWEERHVARASQNIVVQNQPSLQYRVVDVMLPDIVGFSIIAGWPDCY